MRRRGHGHYQATFDGRCGGALPPPARGARYNQDHARRYLSGHKNIAEVLAMTIEDGVDFFRRPAAHRPQARRTERFGGWGYLQIGHPRPPLLSGGEAPSASSWPNELGKLKRGKSNLYLLDEPTTGLHLADIQRLLDSLNRLVEGRSYGLGHRAPSRRHQDRGLHHRLGSRGRPQRRPDSRARGRRRNWPRVSESYTGQFPEELLEFELGTRVSLLEAVDLIRRKTYPPSPPFLRGSGEPDLLPLSSASEKGGRGDRSCGENGKPPPNNSTAS